MFRIKYIVEVLLFLNKKRVWRKREIVFIIDGVKI